MKTITRRNLLKGIGIGAGAAALAACAAPTAAPQAKPAEPAKPAEAKPAAPAVVSNPGSAVTIVHWGFSGGNLEKREKERTMKKPVLNSKFIYLQRTIIH